LVALRTRSLVKRYGRFEAVRDVSIEVERGAIYGLLGPNGSGKTTSLACALGLLRPTSGTAEVLGEPAARIARTRGRVAAVFDRPALVPGLTVAANLRYVRRLLGHRGGRADAEALELVGLDELARQRAGRLSLGQSRRLSIATALIGRPELVVLDEPLSGLDAVGVLETLALFRRLADDGLTLVLSSHRLFEMERVLTHGGVLLDGRLVRQGTLDELVGGGAYAVRVRTTRSGPAGEVARRVPGVACCEVVQPAGDGATGELRVELPREAVPELNRALVEAGCAVSELAPERGGLQAAFEALLREAHAHPETSRAAAGEGPDAR